MSAFVLVLLAKVTAVLLLAACAAVLLRQSSAARRHLIWLIALVAAVALLVVSPVTPSFVVRHSVETAELRVFDTESVAALPAALGAVEVVRRAPYAAARVSLIEIAGFTWMIGCLTILIRCVMVHARLVRGSRAIVSGEWAVALRAAAGEAGVRRQVALMCCEGVDAPATFGFLHPVVLLPADASEWPSERRHVVLVHELAHIARSDYAAQLAGTLACALLWFHPLVWLAAIRLRAEAENAADDRVLPAGIPSAVYAGHLLDLARIESGIAPASVAAVGIATASHLERRFRAMLETSRSRMPVSSRVQAVATSLTLAAMIPLAALRTGVLIPASRTIAMPATTRATPSVSVKAPERIAKRRRAEVAAVASEQTAPAATYPDFSGTWVIDTALNTVNPSKALIIVNGHTGGLATMSVTISQTPTSMTIRRTWRLSAGTYDLNASTEATFDGSPTKGETWKDGRSTEMMTTSAWDGSTLVTTTRNQVDGADIELVDRWSLGADGKTLRLTSTTNADIARGPLPPWTRALASLLAGTTLVFKRQ